MQRRRANLATRRKRLEEARTLLEGRKAVMAEEVLAIKRESRRVPPNSSNPTDVDVERRYSGDTGREKVEGDDHTEMGKGYEGGGKGGGDEKSVMSASAVATSGATRAVAPTLQLEADDHLCIHSSLAAEKKGVIQRLMRLHIIRRRDKHTCLVNSIPLPDDCSTIS